jgi:hypothetical protein
MSAPGAAYSPTTGETPAIDAYASASGTSTAQTVRPRRCLHATSRGRSYEANRRARLTAGSRCFQSVKTVAQSFLTLTTVQPSAFARSSDCSAPAV